MQYGYDEIADYILRKDFLIKTTVFIQGKLQNRENQIEVEIKHIEETDINKKMKKR